MNSQQNTILFIPFFLHPPADDEEMVDLAGSSDSSAGEADEEDEAPPSVSPCFQVVHAGCMQAYSSGYVSKGVYD